MDRYGSSSLSPQRLFKILIEYMLSKRLATPAVEEFKMCISKCKLKSAGEIDNSKWERSVTVVAWSGLTKRGGFSESNPLGDLNDLSHGTWNGRYRKGLELVEGARAAPHYPRLTTPPFTLAVDRGSRVAARVESSRLSGRRRGDPYNSPCQAWAHVKVTRTHARIREYPPTLIYSRQKKKKKHLFIQTKQLTDNLLFLSATGIKK